MKPARRAELAARLRDCGEQEMVELLEAELPELDSEVVRLALGNPHASRRVIELVLSERRLLASHEVQKALAHHPRTPEPRVLNLVPALYWRDLMELGGDTRIRPRVRLAADRRLIERLPRLGAGERVALARRAGPGVVSRLLFDADPRVVEALLENPKLTEPLLAPAINSPLIRPETLALIAADRRWGRRYSVRNSIARNPRAWVGTALDLLATLQKKDLRDVWADRRIATEVRGKAALLLGMDPREAGAPFDRPVDAQ